MLSSAIAATILSLRCVSLRTRKVTYSMSLLYALQAYLSRVWNGFAANTFTITFWQFRELLKTLSAEVLLISRILIAWDVCQAMITFSQGFWNIASRALLAPAAR